MIIIIYVATFVDVCHFLFISAVSSQGKFMSINFSHVVNLTLILYLTLCLFIFTVSLIHPNIHFLPTVTLLKTIEKISEEIHTINLRQHVMNEKLPKITEVLITPSEYKKSMHNQTFLDLMGIFGFSRTHIAKQIVVYDGAPPSRSAELDYTFRWDGQEEFASYEPLLQHLRDHGICAVRVDKGQDLPDSLLYDEEFWTLKRNTSLRSKDLRKASEETIFKYTLRGLTDLVRKNDAAYPLGNSNNRYFIEIKRVKDFVLEDSLREAVLQLIGGNVSNSFHSPPVLLTNLAEMHFVLYITLAGDPRVKLSFNLNVVQMPSFGVALAFVEEYTAEMRSVTLHLGRKPTPLSSPPQGGNLTMSSDDNDFPESFEKLNLEEVVTDDK
jgi:hypothetical protein